MLPAPLRSRATKTAQALGISLGELFRQSLQRTLDAHVTEPDAFFTDKTVFRDDGPTDYAARHDDYLYPEPQ